MKIYLPTIIPQAGVAWRAPTLVVGTAGDKGFAIWAMSVILVFGRAPSV